MGGGKDKAQLERIIPPTPVTDTLRLRGELGDTDSVLIGEQVPYDSQDVTNTQRGAYPPNLHQNAVYGFASGVFSGFEDTGQVLGQQTYDLGPGFGVIAVPDPGDAQNPQAVIGYYPGETEIAVPVAGQGADPNNVTWVWMQLKEPRETTTVNGVQYDVLERVETFPADYPDRDNLIPPETYREMFQVRQLVWDTGLQVPPAENTEGLVALQPDQRQVQNTHNQFYNFVDSIGGVRLRGAWMTPATTAGARVKLSAGEWHARSSNPEDVDAPNRVRHVARDPRPTGKLYSDGAGGDIFPGPGTPPPNIDTAQYSPDHDLVAIPAGHWVIHALWIQPTSGGARQVYGRTAYASKYAAYVAVGKHRTEQIWGLENIGAGSVGLIVALAGATDFNDESQVMLFNWHGRSKAWSLYGTPPTAPGVVLQQFESTATTSDPTTTSLTAVVIPEMTTTFTPKEIGSHVTIGFEASGLHSLKDACFLVQGYVDGSPLKYPLCNVAVKNNGPLPMFWTGGFTTTSLTPLLIEMRWWVDNGTATIVSTNRDMVITEVSAS